jgi:hypothetical protein
VTKDGRPSLINDIRLFFGDWSTYLKGHEEAVAYARRMAWFLNSEGFSLGAYPALYLFLTPSIEVGTAQVTDHGGDWWQRYTLIGVPEDFPTGPDADEIIMRGIVDACLAIKPEQSEVIRLSDAVVRQNAESLRFLVKSHDTKKFKVEVSFNISIWPNPSFLYVTLTNKLDGITVEAPPTALDFYDSALSLVDTIKLDKESITIRPKKSFSGSFVSARIGGPVTFDFADFEPNPSSPVFSKPVRPRG